MPKRQALYLERLAKYFIWKCCLHMSSATYFYNMGKCKFSGKQCGPRSDCSWSDLGVNCLTKMLLVQQTTQQMIFVVINALRVNINALSSIQYCTAVSKELKKTIETWNGDKILALKQQLETSCVETTEFSRLHSSRKNSDVYNIHIVF